MALKQTGMKPPEVNGSPRLRVLDRRPNCSEHMSKQCPKRWKFLFISKTSACCIITAHADSTESLLKSHSMCENFKIPVDQLCISHVQMSRSRNLMLKGIIKTHLKTSAVDAKLLGPASTFRWLR
ncbi:hypothetical protein IscW_ISCW018687 [Ixodes scapularis]|uniref:Uncharacterized protein n=1 Tax=Ixodes scapularis TaxID=6945 RepID=B7PLF5_IXOSC|nr:hypothetical protein IscW_ISCW018687 [Ixodes scapularis]|eukprot:XP_002434603.1 hypothetical protein IscW_ISCW018687 [Ixodes scapularis]